MSLVGSLEDLGLGDILQIIHLSRKSGVLLLRSEQGEGQILFRDGLIRGAFLKGGPTELRELLAARRVLAPGELEAAWEDGHSRGVPLGRVLCDRGLIEADTLDGLRRENIEAAVIRMFSWPSGEFSFEVREVEPDASEELFVSPGLNPQFLALEGTRQIDELDRSEAADDAAEPVFDGEEAAAPSEPDDGADGELLEAAELAEAAEDVAAAELAEAADAVEAVALAAPADTDVEPALAAELVDEAEELSGPWAGPRPPVVAIEGQLPVLEWIKASLGEIFPRVHIFQHSDLGITRIRQYLARSEVPIVLIASDAPADPLSGARDAAEMVRRLKGHAARMPVLLLAEEGASAPAAARARRGQRPDATVVRPTPTQLADPRAVAARSELGGALRDAIERVLRASRRGVQPARRSLPSAVARLREVSARIRDPASRGEVLAHVMAFASEHFARVAMFMVRDDRVVGMAQTGLPRAGGPGDDAFREVDLPRDEAGLFRRVLQLRAAVRGAPADEGDQRLAVLLGNAIPDELYVAPIESGGEVVALLYADNLPAGGPLGDTSAVEIVLHEAGLALDRAVLERALEEMER